MWSNSLPDLELELRTPWVLLTVLAVWLIALVTSFLRVDGLAPLRLPLAAVALASGLFGMSQLASGIGPIAPRHVSWSADDTWRLRDRLGRECIATLASASRQWACVTLLVWRTGTRRRWAILTPGTVGRDQYRRLSVRLRLHRHA